MHSALLMDPDAHLATLATLLVSLLITVAFVGFLFDLDFAHSMATLFIAAMGALIVALVLFLRHSASEFRGEGAHR